MRVTMSDFRLQAIRLGRRAFRWPCVAVALVALATQTSAPRTAVAATTPVEAADRFADGIASVNAPLCTNPQAVGPAESVAAKAEWAYLAGYRFRHVRDGFLRCYNQSTFDAAWAKLAAGGAKLLATELFSYTDDDLRNARKIEPALEGLTAGNEWDADKTQIRLGIDATAGDTSVTTTPTALAFHMVAGQSYRIDDEQPETFVLSAPTGRSTGTIASPLRYSHSKGARLVRAGDFVSDIDAWLAYYAPRLKRAQPPFPVIGASLAFTIHANAFMDPTDRSDGKYGLDAVEEHGYPGPMGSNPEGPDGDGGRGYIHVDHPPCSVGHTSYSVAFNTCEAARQTGRAGIPIWDTEYSYNVVANGDGPLPATSHPIPDRVAIAYLARSEFFVAARGRSRLYWFQMLDGTSGPASGFCTYGLIYTGLCADGDRHEVPSPKGEMLTLGDLIQFFSDPACTFPKCTWSPSQMDLAWSDTSLPLNASTFGWKSGKIGVVAWLGAKSYDFDDEGECMKTSSCTVSVKPRTERLSSPQLRGAKSIEVRTLDTNPSNPPPPEIAVDSPDGSAQKILACPKYPKQNFYGCLTTPRAVAVQGDTVTFDVTDVPTIVTFTPQKS